MLLLKRSLWSFLSAKGRPNSPRRLALAPPGGRPGRSQGNHRCLRGFFWSLPRAAGRPDATSSTCQSSPSRRDPGDHFPCRTHRRHADATDSDALQRNSERNRRESETLVQLCPGTSRTHCRNLRGRVREPPPDPPITRSQFACQGGDASPVFGSTEKYGCPCRMV